MNILTAAYQHRRQAALAKHRAGIPVVGYTSNTVPVELLEAAGFFPVLLDADKALTPLADAYMEPVFDRRTKGMFDDILAGEWAFLTALIIPRTSEAEHKLFLYLTEVGRRTRQAGIPEIYFFDFLHSQKELSRAYSFRQTVRLQEYLAELAGRPAAPERLAQAIARTNELTHAMQQLVAFRAGPAPQLAGVEAMTLLGASYFMGRAEYLVALSPLLVAIAQRPPLAVRRRVLLKGFPLNNTRLHQAIEQADTLVVAEDDWFGSRAVGQPLRPDVPALEALFEKYFTATPSPRVFPAAKANEWFEKAARSGIDEVIFYLPDDDDTYGWDYPAQQAFLAQCGVASSVARSPNV